MGPGKLRIQFSAAILESSAYGTFNQIGFWSYHDTMAPLYVTLVPSLLLYVASKSDGGNNSLTGLAMYVSVTTGVSMMMMMMMIIIIM